MLRFVCVMLPLAGSCFKTLAILRDLYLNFERNSDHIEMFASICIIYRPTHMCELNSRNVCVCGKTAGTMCVFSQGQPC